MDAINLEFRISRSHIGSGKIWVPGLQTQRRMLFWSYARHLPPDWDTAKIEARRSVSRRLLSNLDSAEGNVVDLSPLRDNQRASGVVGGKNPLQAMYDMIVELAKRHQDYPFFGKWGGSRRKGEGFAFYVEGEADAALMVERMTQIASDMHIPLEIAQQYGTSALRKFIVSIDDEFRGAISDLGGFRAELESTLSYPHFFHELF